ncbi:MAG: hypothetical protein ACUVQ1_04865 [Candidatus Kapaibacteriales bacterium]
MIYVYPKLSEYDFYFIRFFGPGLGNLLFPWAKAIVLAKKFGLVPIFPTFRQVKVGTILRREPDLRWYFSLFKPTNFYVKSLKKYFLLARYKKISQTEFLKLYPNIEDNRIVVVEGMEDYFLQFLEEYDFIRRELVAITRLKFRKGLSFDFQNSITLHIRLGDFQAPTEEKLRRGEFVRMPLDWYASFIQAVRAETGSPIPCFVFTNGSIEEIASILKLGNVEILSFGSSIADLLAMSKSKLLVSSASTFAMWASFLGRMPTIYYPGQIKQRLYYDNPEFEIEWKKGIPLPTQLLEIYNK